SGGDLVRDALLAEVEAEPAPPAAVRAGRGDIIIGPGLVVQVAQVPQPRDGRLDLCLVEVPAEGGAETGLATPPACQHFEALAHRQALTALSPDRFPRLGRQRRALTQPVLDEFLEREHAGLVAAVEGDGGDALRPALDAGDGG